jgi:hypothetical protein
MVRHGSFFIFGDAHVAAARSIDLAAAWRVESARPQVLDKLHIIGAQ